ncbi:hypothetical protein A9Q86_13105 [Flavobacteriales bacterium 33_180_T64]|nr:hypothetical protein A9Q86_13105 [Flavobacteriales bacterium 33_180_T64]
MKKIFALVLCVSIFTLSSCEDEPLEGDFITGGISCEQATFNTAEAALNFLGVNDDNYTQLCAAYSNALQAQIQACGDDGTLQTALDALGDCTNEQQQATDIEGTWLLTAWLGETAIDLNNDGTESFNFLDEMDCYANETLVFNADGTSVGMSTSYADIDVSIEVGTTNSYDYNVSCIDEIENTNGTWSQSGNTITITDDVTAESSDWTLNGNELSIVVPSGFFAISEDATITVTEDLTFIYTKQ